MVSCPEEKKDEEAEADDECTGSTTDVEPGSRAWKSGSMLVRPKGDNGCEQVSDRPTYIYLIGKESIPVELIVGPLGSQVNNKRAIKTACCDWLPKILVPGTIY